MTSKRASIFEDTKNLKNSYYKISTAVSIFSLIVGLIILMVLVFYVGPMYGLDPDAKTGGVEFKYMVMGVIVFLLCMYSGVLIVAGTFSVFMCRTGKFSKAEAIKYTCYFRYPEYWLDENHNKQ